METLFFKKNDPLILKHLSNKTYIREIKFRKKRDFEVIICYRHLQKEQL